MYERKISNKELLQFRLPALELQGKKANVKLTVEKVIHVGHGPWPRNPVSRDQTTIEFEAYPSHPKVWVRWIDNMMVQPSGSVTGCNSRKRMRNYWPKVRPYLASQPR